MKITIKIITKVTVFFTDLNIIYIDCREQLDYMTSHLDTYGKEYPIDKHEK